MEINNLLFIFFIIFGLWVTSKLLLKGVGCFEDWVMVANMGLYDQSTYILSSKVWCNRRTTFGLVMFKESD